MSVDDLPCLESDFSCAIACHRVLLSGATPQARLALARHLHAASGGTRIPFLTFETSRLRATPDDVTLFIAELGDLGPSEQKQLLDTLDRWMTHHVRIISATGYRVLDLVESRRLDETLLYRLNIIHIKLRE